MLMTQRYDARAQVGSISGCCFKQFFNVLLVRQFNWLLAFLQHLNKYEDDDDDDDDDASTGAIVRQ